MSSIFPTTWNNLNNSRKRAEVTVNECGSDGIRYRHSRDGFTLRWGQVGRRLAQAGSRQSAQAAACLSPHALSPLGALRMWPAPPQGGLCLARAQGT